MVKTEIEDVNNVPKATVTTPQVSNAPKVDDELRKQIMAEEEAKAEAAKEAAKAQAAIAPEPKVNMSAPKHIDQNPIVNPTPQVVNEGLTADDMSRINQNMNSLKRELKEEAISSDETAKKLEADIRAKILLEMQEEQAQKTIATQVANSNETILQLQEQIQVLNDRVPKAIGQEVSGSSPFDNEKSMENASESDINRIDEASRIAFQQERMRL